MHKVKSLKKDTPTGDVNVDVHSAEAQAALNSSVVLKVDNEIKNDSGDVHDDPLHDETRLRKQIRELEDALRAVNEEEADDDEEKENKESSIKRLTSQIEELKNKLKEFEDYAHHYATQVEGDIEHLAKEAVVKADLQEKVQKYEDETTIASTAEVSTEASNKTEESFMKMKSRATSSQIVEATSACMSGVISAIPPSFCYKKGADAGTIPTGCPSGYFRSLALCYKNCDDDYKFVAGVCWEQGCRGGYTDAGLTCWKLKWKGWKLKVDTYWKDSYIPSSITNFDSRIPCPDGKYKSGALCYRDCAQIGLVNCGIGACAASGTACGTGIGVMAIEFALGLAEGLIFVASFGTSSAGSAGISAAKEQLVSGFKKIGTTALKDGLNTMKRFAASATLKTLLKKEAKAAALKAIKSATISYLGTTFIELTCNQVADDFIDNSVSKNDVSDLDLTMFDPTGIASAVTSCENVGQSENDNLTCSKAILNAVSIADPTGITAMAAALIQEVCEVP